MPVGTRQLTDIEQDIERVLLGIGQELQLATDSKSLPDIPNKKNKTNWVEKAGGLPKYIERIAKHLRSEKGMDTSRAIAVAVNTVKRWCSSGQVTEGDSHGVSGATKAQACKAVAEWEAKKAKSGGTKASAQIEKPRWVVLEGAIVSESDRDFIQRYGEVLLSAADESFNLAGYTLALSRARSGLHLAVSFDPQAHPRDFHGKFKAALGSLKKGDSIKLPDGVEVKKSLNDEKKFTVRRPDSHSPGTSNPMVDLDKAASVALTESTSAGKKGKLPDSLDAAKTESTSSGAAKTETKSSEGDAHQKLLDDLYELDPNEKKTLPNGATIQQRANSTQLLAWDVKDPDGKVVTVPDGDGSNTERAVAAALKADKPKDAEGGAPEGGEDLSEEDQFNAVSSMIDRFVEGGEPGMMGGNEPEFTGAADEIRDVFHAIQDPEKAVADGLDYEAESVLDELEQVTSKATGAKDKALNAWAKKMLAELQKHQEE